MDKLLFKRILVFALTALAVIYVAYLLISANFDMYPTENAVLATVTDKIVSNGFIIRDENVINNSSSGVLSYSCSEGEQVQSGGEIAKVYSSESDAVSQTTAAQLQKKIESLKELQQTSLTGSVEIDVINNMIEDKIITYLDDINDSDINLAKSDNDNLLNSINQRLLCTGKISNFNSEISQLQSQLDSLTSSSGKSTGTITTDKAGYFTEFCDGYENAFDYSKVSDMTLADLKDIKKSSVSDNTAGKVVSDIVWYVACEVTSDEAASLSTWDSQVSLLLSEASSESMPAQIYKIHHNADDENALVVLKCDYMNERTANQQKGNSRRLCNQGYL